MRPYVKGHATLLGVLDRVVQHVYQDLLDPHLVTVNLGGKLRVDVDAQLEPLVPGVDPHHGDDVRNHVAHRVVGKRELHLARFELGHVQDVVYQVQEHAAGRCDLAGVLGDLVRDVFAQNHLVQPDDRVHRRANLVAHAREEAVLGAVQLQDLLLLRRHDAALLMRDMQLEQEHDDCQDGGDDERRERVNVGRCHGELVDELGKHPGENIACEGDHDVAGEEEGSQPAPHGERDEHERYDAPVRGAGVNAAIVEERERQHEKHQHERAEPGADLNLTRAQRNCHSGNEEQVAHSEEEDARRKTVRHPGDDDPNQKRYDGNCRQQPIPALIDIARRIVELLEPRVHLTPLLPGMNRPSVWR